VVKIIFGVAAMLSVNKGPAVNVVVGGVAALLIVSEVLRKINEDDTEMDETFYYTSDMIYLQ